MLNCRKHNLWSFVEGLIDDDTIQLKTLFMTKIAKTDTSFMGKMAETPYPLGPLPSNN